MTIVAGKGGVGKTTVAATLALAASRCGLRALVVEVEGKSGLPSLFDHAELPYHELELAAADPASGRGPITARRLTPDEALAEYLADHGLHRISKRLSDSGAMDMVAAATPGIKDVLILGKVKQLERSGTADVIIVDAPAAGHAISFLRSASGLLDAVSVGPIHTQAADVLELLGDGDRCQVVLVTLPEETPVNELVETAYSLEDQVGVKLGPVVVNGIYEALDGLAVDPLDAAADAGVTLDEAEADRLRRAATFRRQRRALQDEQLDRLDRELPLPQINLPYRFASELALHEVEELATRLLAEIERLPDEDGAP